MEEILLLQFKISLTVYIFYDFTLLFLTHQCTETLSLSKMCGTGLYHLNSPITLNHRV